MRNLCLLPFVMIMLMVSCDKTQVHYSVSSAESFNMTVIDSVNSVYNCKFKDLLSNGKSTLLYISNNECSECISRFIDFNNIVRSTQIDSVNIVYWIYGCDHWTFEYYMEPNKTDIRQDVFFLIDTLDVFHKVIHDFYSNNLFVIESPRTIARIMYDKSEYEWASEALQTWLKQILNSNQIQHPQMACPLGVPDK